MNECRRFALLYRATSSQAGKDREGSSVAPRGPLRGLWRHKVFAVSSIASARNGERPHLVVRSRTRCRIDRAIIDRATLGAEISSLVLLTFDPRAFEGEGAHRSFKPRDLRV
jgi:hypothetical protein